MLPQDFVERLAAAAPSISRLLELGLDHQEAADLRRQFYCPRRDPAGAPEQNEVLALLKGWDVSAAQIGMVSFLQPPVATPTGIQVGRVEADDLVLLPDTGELVVEELGTDGHVLWRAAAGPGAFLDALCLSAEYLAKCGMPSSGSPAEPRLVAEQAALLAGGDQYWPFYFMLLGVED